MKWFIENHKPLFVVLYMGILLIIVLALGTIVYFVNGKVIDEYLMSLVTLASGLSGYLIAKGAPEFADGKPGNGVK